MIDAAPTSVDTGIILQLTLVLLFLDTEVSLNMLWQITNVADENDLLGLIMKKAIYKFEPQKSSYIASIQDSFEVL